MKVNYSKPKLVILSQSEDVLCTSPGEDYVGNIWDYVSNGVSWS